MNTPATFPSDLIQAPTEKPTATNPAGGWSTEQQPDPAHIEKAGEGEKNNNKEKEVVSASGGSRRGSRIWVLSLQNTHPQIHYLGIILRI